MYGRLRCHRYFVGIFNVSVEAPTRVQTFYVYSKKQNRESTNGYSRLKTSKDMASSRNLVSTIGALASPKFGGRKRQSVAMCPVLFVHLLNLRSNYLFRKYGLTINNFTKSGTLIIKNVITSNSKIFLSSLMATYAEFCNKLQ